MPKIQLKELGFTCSAFQHDKAYGSYKDLVNRTKSDRVLKDKVFKITSNPKYDGYEREYKISNQQSGEIHKPIIKNLKIEKYILHLKTIFGELICN